MRLPTDEQQLKVGIRWFTNFAIDSVTIAFNTTILAAITPLLTIGAMILQDFNLVIAWWNVQFQKGSQPPYESAKKDAVSSYQTLLVETTKDHQASPVDDILIE